MDLRLRCCVVPSSISFLHSLFLKFKLETRSLSCKLPLSSQSSEIPCAGCTEIIVHAITETITSDAWLASFGRDIRARCWRLLSVAKNHPRSIIRFPLAQFMRATPRSMFLNFCGQVKAPFDLSTSEGGTREPNIHAQGMNAYAWTSS